jgi:two-component system, NarL family, sensor kinase
MKYLLSFMFVLLSSSTLPHVFAIDVEKKMLTNDGQSIELMYPETFMSSYFELMSETGMNFDFVHEGWGTGNIQNMYFELADFLLDKAIYYFEQDKFEKTELFFYGALYIYMQLYDLERTAFILNFLGTVSQNRGKYEVSMQRYLMALRFYEVINDDNGISNTLNNIGVLYKVTGDLDKSLVYARRTFEMKRKLKNSEGVAASLTNMGNIYSSKKEYAMALEYHLHSLRLYESMNDTTGIAVAYNNIGSSYIELEMYDEALGHLLSAYAMNKRRDAKHSATLNIMNISNLYFKQGKLKQSKQWALRGYEKSKEMGTRGLHIPIYRLLVEICEADNDFKNAFYYQSKYIVLSDSLWDVETRGRFEELEYKYETQKKQSQIEIQQKQILEQELKLNRRFIFIIIVVFVLLTFVLLSSYFIVRLRMKQQRVFNSYMLEQEKNKTKAVIEAIEEERKRIARDIHDGLGQNLASLKLKMLRISEGMKTDTRDVSGLQMEEAIVSLDETYKEARNLSHQMMPKTLLFLGLVDAINDLTEKVLHNTQIDYSFDHNTQERFSQSIEIAMYRIYQELLNNVLKHSQASLLEISLLQTAGQLMLIFEDNGVGLKEKVEKEKGIGLLNIEARVHSLNGQFEITSKEGEGTTSIVRVPI